MDEIKSVGIGASVALLTALIVNMTLTPALLYSQGQNLVDWQLGLERWVRRQRDRAAAVCGAARRGGAYAPAGGGGEPPLAARVEEGVRTKSSDERSDDGGPLPLPPHVVGGFTSAAAPATSVDLDLAELEGMYKSWWFKLATFLLEPKKGLAVVCVIVALCIPACCFALSEEISISFDLMVPNGHPAYQTYVKRRRCCCMAAATTTAPAVLPLPPSLAVRPTPLLLLLLNVYSPTHLSGTTFSATTSAPGPRTRTTWS